MTTKNPYKEGEFCWAELMTTNVEAAKKFYQKTFGWEYTDDEMPQGGTYTMARFGDKHVAGLYQMSKEQQAQKIPAHWCLYVNVADADETAAEAKKLGGKLLMAPFDVLDVGRMAHIEDPTGAAIAVWEPRKHRGAHKFDKTKKGAFSWAELITDNVDQAGSFYAKLFGWAPKAQKFGDTTYTSFMLGKTSAAGMIPKPKAMQTIPAHWAVYFNTDNTDTTVKTATAESARTVIPPTEIPTVGRFATLTDPAGATFSVIKTA